MGGLELLTMNNRQVKELLVNSQYYMGLHVYDKFYKLVYPDGSEAIIVISDEHKDSFHIDDTEIYCPRYAIRVVINYMILKECQIHQYDYDIFCIFNEETLLNESRVYDVIKEVPGLDLELEAKLLKVFTAAVSEGFPPQYVTLAETCGVLQGYVLLSKMFEGEKE